MTPAGLGRSYRPVGSSLNVSPTPTSSLRRERYRFSLVSSSPGLICDLSLANKNFGLQEPDAKPDLPEVGARARACALYVCLCTGFTFNGFVQE